MIQEEIKNIYISIQCRWKPRGCTGNDDGRGNQRRRSCYRMLIWLRFRDGIHELQTSELIASQEKENSQGPTEDLQQTARRKLRNSWCVSAHHLTFPLIIFVSDSNRRLTNAHVHMFASPGMTRLTSASCVETLSRGLKDGRHSRRRPSSFLRRKGRCLPSSVSEGD